MSDDTRARGYFPQHEAYLSARGVRLEVAVCSGIRSLGPNEVNKFLRWGAPAACAGMLIPHCDPQGKLIMGRVRLDAAGAGPKFQMRKGVEVIPWIPSQPVLEVCGFSQNVLTDTSRELVVVEGPVKAMALNGVGILAIGLGGVSAGGHDAALRAKRGEIRAHPLLREIVRDRRVTIAFDAGIANNPSVADGAALNALAFEAEGATVWVARIPFTDKGLDQGPDDFLARHGVDELRALLSASVPANPPARVREILMQLVQHGSKGERQAEATEALIPVLDDILTAAMLRRGTPALCAATASEVQRATGMSLRVVRQAVERFEERLRGNQVKTSSRGELREDDSRPEIMLSADLHCATDHAIQALR
ncbi:MAG: hypothetical protein RLZZ450_2526, partial [Pseudomonadota bacterium]